MKADSVKWNRFPPSIDIDPIFEYERCGCVSMLNVMGLIVYSRVGDVRMLLGVCIPSLISK